MLKQDIREKKYIEDDKRELRGMWNGPLQIVLS